MATPKQYYSHGMTPYAYEWRGIPTPAYQRSHASLGAIDLGSLAPILLIGGLIAAWWFTRKK